VGPKVLPRLDSTAPWIILRVMRLFRSRLPIISIEPCLPSFAKAPRLKPIGNFVHTITFDNGKEFAAHQDIAHALKAKIFFATPYHAWERGLNENTNGLIRDFFPKGTDFSTISNAEVAKVERLLNARPRKSLGFRSPQEVFHFLAYS